MQHPNPRGPGRSIPNPTNPFSALLVNNPFPSNPMQIKKPTKKSCRFGERSCSAAGTTCDAHDLVWGFVSWPALHQIGLKLGIFMGHKEEVSAASSLFELVQCWKDAAPFLSVLVLMTNMSIPAHPCCCFTLQQSWICFLEGREGLPSLFIPRTDAQQMFASCGKPPLD